MAKLLDVIGVRVKEIAEQINTKEEILNGWDIRHAKHTAPEEYEFFDAGYSSINMGDIWGRQGQTAFISKDITVPADWAGMHVGLLLKTEGEGLLRVDGKPFHGVDDNRGYILLTPSARGGETYSCELEMKPGGQYAYIIDNPTKPYILSVAKLIAIDKQVEDAYYDFKVVWDAAAVQSDSVLKEAILLAMKDALYQVDFRDRTTPDFRSALTSARESLRRNLDAIDFGDVAGKTFYIGHSHIDLAWLWPLKETMRKVGRTFSTVAALMDEYPDYHFVCSQVPLFLYMKQYFPDIYSRLKERIAEGRFEPIGGTWIENDCNIISGESMVRQCLYGQRFFRDELCVNVRVGWLPDVFGYSWAMPQIYKKSGLDYFIPPKISWNDTNPFPCRTFFWQGIDGTKILSHFVHGFQGNPEETTKIWKDYKPRLANPEVMMTYGYGDGGGGPTREMMEYVPRLVDIPGLPESSTGMVHDFFDRLAEKSDDFPVWNDELYLELHRGTFTSQAKNKCNNRRCELAYREAEIWNSISVLYGGSYPKKALEEGWHGILLNQFHDIIPGSSIREVYDDSDRQYAGILSSGSSMISSAAEHIAKQLDTRGDGQAVVVFNSLPWDRSGVVSIDAKNCARVIDAQNNELPIQMTDNKLSFVTNSVPSCGYEVYRIVDGGASSQAPFNVDGENIFTPYYDLTLASDGTITRLYDKENAREVIPEGARANVFQLFEDKPSDYEAWEIELQYMDKMWECEPDSHPEVIECGPVKLVMGLSLCYGSSKVDQQIVFYAHSPRIDFITQVDWQERRTMLKVAFPVNIRSRRATYEIAFGAIERPTHWNTSWDKARFEVCGHKWADLSETGYGLSILNDCKYGWDIKDNVMRLTLLKASVSPDPEADRGTHKFTYSLLPHAGDWTSGTVHAGYELNCPLTCVAESNHDGKLGAKHSFISVDNENVILDTVKQAEDDDSIIMRLYEAHNSRGPVCITFDRPIASAAECNLLEEDEKPVEINGCDIEFAIKPFEIRTFKVKLEN